MHMGLQIMLINLLPFTGVMIIFFKPQALLPWLQYMGFLTNHKKHTLTDPGGVMVERSLGVRKVAGSIPSRDIPKVVKRWYK